MYSILKFKQATGALPEVLSGNTIYLVKVNTHLEIYLSNPTGTVAYKVSVEGSEGTPPLTLEAITNALGFTPANASVLADLEAALININGV